MIARVRPRTLTGLIIGSLILTVACALFAIQYAQAYSECSAQIVRGSCSEVPSVVLAADGLFASIAGLLAAIVIGITTGINFRTEPSPNLALARRLQAEDESFRAAEQRRAELRELNAIALSHVVTQKADAEAAKQEADKAAAEAAEQALANGEATPGQPQWEEEKEVESEEQRRRRLLADRILQLARRRPEVMAGVVRGWIDQPSRR
ncbi:MAG TPA: hypothetical protein VKU60_02260 [Chloroflexota bacterium]|nr:hypothetical protein [Chloroflexota bacterium]